MISTMTHLFFWFGYKVILLFICFVQAVALFFTVYQTIVSYVGFRKRKIITLESPQKRFAILIPAHNEEVVISQIVESIRALDYPKELYDIFMICDNCTDRTEEIVRALEVKTFVRHNPDKVGKGYALEWAFEKLWNYMDSKNVQYDAVVILDADNLISRNFLMVMNSKLLEGHEVIQSYLDSKNPRDTWVTKAYAFSYWATNRTFQLARENIGLSAQLGGTGVVVATKVLRELGWEATSLTEDLEFTQRYLLYTGKRVAWAHDAKVYDEKPLTFHASWRQRVRWMSGHVDCMINYAIPLLKKCWKEKSFIYFDSAIYLMQPSRILLSMSLIIFTIFAFFDVLASLQIIDKWVYFSITLLYHLLPIIGLLLEKRAEAIWWIFRTYIFSYTWLPIVLMGFIKRNQRVWNHTLHVRSISIHELENDFEQADQQAISPVIDNP